LREIKWSFSFSCRGRKDQGYRCSLGHFLGSRIESISHSKWYQSSAKSAACSR